MADLLGQSLKLNTWLSMPNADTFTKTLRGTDVNSLTLLTEVNTVSIYKKTFPPDPATEHQAKTSMNDSHLPYWA